MALPPGFKTPGADPRARQRSENPTPGATRMCESPGVARGGWLGLELSDTLGDDLAHFSARIFQKVVGQSEGLVSTSTLLKKRPDATQVK